MKNTIKRRIYSLVTAFILIVGIVTPLLLPFIAAGSDISNAQWYAIINVTNNSTASVYDATAVFSINATALVNQGYTNSSLTNCTIVDANGADVPFSSGYGTNTMALYAGNVSAAYTKSFTFYTGNVTGGHTAWFPGAAGMSVPDNATLEWGNSGNVSITACFNPSSTDPLFTKGNDLRGIQNGDGTVTLYVPTTGSGSYNEAMTGSYNSFQASAGVYNTVHAAASGTTLADIKIGQRWVNPNYYIFRGFVVFDTSAIPDGATITGAVLHLKGSGDNSDTDFNITIRNGQPAYPTDPLAATDFNFTYYSGTGGTLSTAGFNAAGDNSINLDATGLTWINKTGSTKLALLSSRDISSTSPGGNEFISAAKAGTYLAVSYTYNVGPTTGVISGGVHTFVPYISGGNLGIQVDAGAPFTSAYAGSITNNTDNWTFCPGDSMFYVDTITASAGGSPVSAWEWEYGAIFHDSIGVNDGTPSFRTSSSPAIQAVMASFAPVVEAKASSSIAGGISPWTTPPAKPSGLTTPSGSISVPFIYDVLHSFFMANPSYGTAAEKLFWYIISLLVILTGGFLAQKYGKSIIIKTCTMGALIVGGALSNVYGLWILITFTCYAFGIIIMSRHYGF